jgi:transcriptional regulator with XRE-family HTH domain
MAKHWEDFGKYIRGLREQQEMTQSYLATKLDKSSSEVSRWEKGERRPKQDSLMHLANLFGVPIQVLQQKAGYTPEFNWLSSFLDEAKPPQEDILLTATDAEKEELREYLRYIRFKGRVLELDKPT